MNTVSIPVSTELPKCLGKDWDRNAVECAGGPDPGFDDGRGGHIRKQCNYYQTCAARTQASKQQSLLLARPPAPAPQAAPTAPPQTFEGYLSRQIEQQRQAAAATVWRPPVVLPQVAPVPQYPSQYQPHPQAMQPYYPQQPGPQFPAAQYQLNYQVPGYLTVPEDRADGEGLMSVLFREMCRGTGKAAGQVLAHFFDVRTFRGK